MIFVWVNKRNWKHPGPIMNVGVHNAHALAQLGHETYFCIGQGEASDTEEDLKEIYDLTPSPHLHIHRVPRKQLGKTTLSLSIFSEAKSLIQRLQKKDRVVVLTREASFVPFLAKLCRDKKTLGFYEAHNFYADLFWCNDHLSFQDYKQELIENLFLPQLSGVICITEPQKELYQRKFPKLPAINLPLGTKPQAEDIRLILEPRRLKRKVVYVGNLDREKGVADLVKMASELNRRNIQMALWGGSQEQIKRFKKLMHEEKVQDTVECIGFRPLRELHEALASEVSLGLVPLQDTFYNRYLTCPAKALDYLSFGLPIIASDLLGVKTLLQDAALYFDSDKPQTLAQTCEMLLADRANYENACEQSHQRGFAFSWSQRAQKLVQWVESLL
ncbi:MAG: glycosyltransferase [Verrucomicrobiae bacterium]|nr:glycosyltransferase [Verrucomicrobiae bacterium]